MLKLKDLLNIISFIFTSLWILERI